MLDLGACHAALGTSATATVTGSGASVMEEDEPFPFAGCPQTTQNESPSLTNELQLPQLFATKASAWSRHLKLARDNGASGQPKITTKGH
jgi:hypothetical protein